MSVTPVRRGWRRMRIGDIATVSRGASPRPIASPRWFSDRSKIGWVRIADLGRSDGLTLTSTVQRLSPDGVARSRLLPPGTLIMSIAATVGRPIVTAIPACIHDGFVALENLKGVDRTYLLYVLKSLESELRAAGQTGSQANVNTAIVEALVIPVPAEAEQKAIGSVLSSADRTIAALQRLITKKQAIKHGVMQRLLTGKARLADFGEPWQARQLGDLLTYEQPGRFLVDATKQLSAGQIPVLTAGKTFILGYTNDTDGVYSSHPVIIFDDFTTASKYVDFDFKAKSSAMKILSARPNCDTRFIYQRMQLIQFPLGDHKRYWISEYSKQRVNIPSLAEQQAISKVITVAGDEIEALKRRLAKAHDIKSGMMQELLSGRTRLPIEKTAP
jgi:type I restriction enzyme, S subunit